MIKFFKHIWIACFITSLFGGAFENVIYATEKSYHSTDPKLYNLSICALFKNEATYLKEWIEYHRLIGVDHFYLYNVGSTDQYLDVLEPYIKKNTVTLIEWKDFVSEQGKADTYLWALGTQIPVYENAIKLRAINETKWLVFIEIDEFLVFNNAENLTEVLEKYSDYPGVTLISDYFDASRMDILPKRKLLIETVALTKPPQRNPWKGVAKTIFKPEFCKGFNWPPYNPSFKDNQSPMKIRKRDLCINNYTNRDVGYFNRSIKQKLSIDNRSISDEEVNELLSLDYEIEDNYRVVYRFVPELQKRMGFDSGWNW